MASVAMKEMLDSETAWAAFMARDRAWDGRFVVAVRTTRIYCRPSCPARRPARENVAFYPDGSAAREAGYRACLRCSPDDARRDVQAVEKALALMARVEDALSLDDLSRAVGYAPHHFQRLFKAHAGLSPAAHMRALRAERLETALQEDGRVTDAIYDAGYASASRAYADAERRLGMTPTARRAGGAGTVIRFAIAQSSLGPLLIAATDRGLCRISFDETEADLRALFPRDRIEVADPAFALVVQEVVALVDDPARASSLPVDVRGTLFQQAVWEALRTIPPGETRSYGEIAVAIGRPGAVRAVGTACGANRLAVLIPCHRVVKTDGALGDYAYGPDRKRALLERERTK